MLFENEKSCDHFIGFEFCRVHEEFNCYYDSQSKSEEYFDNYSRGVYKEKFEYCPFCGEKIDWDKYKEEVSE